jgi:hypothetical protein
MLYIIPGSAGGSPVIENSENVEERPNLNCSKLKNKA